MTREKVKFCSRAITNYLESFEGVAKCKSIVVTIEDESPIIKNKSDTCSICNKICILSYILPILGYFFLMLTSGSLFILSNLTWVICCALCIFSIRCIEKYNLMDHLTTFYSKYFMKDYVPGDAT